MTPSSLGYSFLAGLPPAALLRVHLEGLSSFFGGVQCYAVCTLHARPMRCSVYSLVYFAFCLQLDSCLHYWLGVHAQFRGFNSQTMIHCPPISRRNRCLFSPFTGSRAKLYIRFHSPNLSFALNISSIEELYLCIYASQLIILHNYKILHLSMISDMTMQYAVDI